MSHKIRKFIQNRVVTFSVNFITIVTVFANLLCCLIRFSFIGFMLGKTIVFCRSRNKPILSNYNLLSLSNIYKNPYQLTYVSTKLTISNNKCSSSSSLCNGCRASSQIAFFKQLLSYPILWIKCAKWFAWNA